MPHGDHGGAATPAELLANNVVLTPTQLAAVLGLVYTRGKAKGAPDVTKARSLIRSRGIRIVGTTDEQPDPEKIPPTHWAVPVTEVMRYIAEGPRRTAGAA